MLNYSNKYTLYNIRLQQSFDNIITISGRLLTNVKNVFEKQNVKNQKYHGNKTYPEAPTVYRICLCFFSII